MELEVINFKEKLLLPDQHILNKPVVERSAETKLAGKSPSPLQETPFHQFGSLNRNKESAKCRSFFGKKCAYTQDNNMAKTKETLY